MKTTGQFPLLLMAMAMLIMVSGCSAVSINTTPYAGVPKYPPSPDPAQIQILHKWPGEQYVSLGKVMAQPNAKSVSPQVITQSIQKAAAKMGANAVVIVSDRKQVIGESYMGSWYEQEGMGTPVTGVVIVGVAIRYTGSPSPAGPVINSKASP